MKVNGLEVNTQAIAEGMYRIICEKGEEAIVAFGMIPLWIVEMTEKQLLEKIISEKCRETGWTPEELAPYLSKEMVDDMVSQIMRHICTGIYTAAGNANKMLV